MKILLKKEVETESEFPTPSFWKGEHSFLMITENVCIKVTSSLIILSKSTDYLYEKNVADVLNEKCFEHFQKSNEVEFLKAYRATDAEITKAISQPY